MPPSTNAIADLSVRDTVACRNHMSDNLMARYSRTVVISPSVPSIQKLSRLTVLDWETVHPRQFAAYAVGLCNVVGETNTASLDLDQHLTRVRHRHWDIFNAQRGTSLFESSLLVVRREIRRGDVGRLILALIVLSV